MATITFLRRSDNKNIGSVGSVIAYCVQQKKTQYMNARLISGINCLPETAMQDFVATKKRWKNYLLPYPKNSANSLKTT